jgi:serine/threonine-protein kinase
MRCLDESELFELFEQAMPPSRRCEVERHLDECAACRGLVAAFARASDTEADLPFASTTMGSVPSTLPPPGTSGEVIAARYELLRVVGEGGMGIVWAAHDHDTGKAVALKFLKSGIAEHVKRFTREAKVAAAVGHPNVLEVREILHPPNAPPVLVSDLLEGESLDRRIAREGKLSEAQTRGIMIPLADAVAAAHAKGIIHRDLKPQNVFLAERVMLLDFGMAKLLTQDDAAADALTRSGAILGTPHYMAPEQLYGERLVDERADVWAMGVVAYECISGRRPLEGRSYGQILRSATRGVIAPLEEGSAQLRAIIERMLSHERDQRPAAADVAAALRSL